MGIGKTLSNILEENNSNPNELSERTGIPPSTIYSIIKRDNMKVDISVLARICKELGVEMNRFYDEYFDEIKNTSISLNPNEKKLIKKYRTLDEHGKRIVNNILDIEHERCSKIATNTPDMREIQNKTDNKAHIVYKAARSNSGKKAGYVEVSQEKLDRLKNAPETDDDFS